jgi:hypothetical protein
MSMGPIRQVIGDVWTAPVPCALDDPPTVGSFVRPPAFASWILLLPLGNCASLTVRRLPLPTDPIGVAMFRMEVMRSGRVPSVRRGLGFPQPDRCSSGFGLTQVITVSIIAFGDRS